MTTRQATPPRDTRPLATTAEVAAFLRVPEETLRYWRKRRTGPPWVRAGHHIRYRWSAVEEWLDQSAAS